MVFLGFVCVVNLFFIKKYVKFNFNLSKLLVAPIAASIISGVVMYFIRLVLINLNIWLYCVISAGMGLFVYVGLIILFKSFNKAEMYVFKGRNILNKTSNV